MSLFSRRVDKQLEAYQRELVDTHYKEVENMYRQIRGWRHDYRNHIQVLKAFAAKGDMDAIRASGLELTDTMEQVLSGAVETVRKNELYTPTAFAGGNAVRKVLEYSMGDEASADGDTALERIAAGQSAEAAMAEFLTDDYFEKWYQATLAQLQQYEG